MFTLVVGWLIKYILVWVILTFFTTFTIYLWVRLRNRRNPRAHGTVVSIRQGSLQTFGSLAIGVSLSLTVAVMTWDLFTLAAAARFAGVAGLPPFIQYAPHPLGAIIGITVAYWGIYLPGRKSKTSDRPYFDIKPGEKAYLSILGQPFGNLGPGWAWRVPALMDYTIRKTAGIEVRSDNREEYLTENGTELFVKMGVVVTIDNPLAAEGIAQGDVSGYLDARRKSAMRYFVGTQKLNLDLAFKANATPEEQVEAFKQLTQIKGDISKNGPSTVLELMNREIEPYGMRATQVQFEEVIFNDILEGKIQRAFDEIAEAPGLQKDTLNKISMMELYLSNLCRLTGIKLENLSQEQRLAFVKQVQAYSLAVEGQGGYNFNDFGGPLPKSVLLNISSEIAHNPKGPKS